MPDLIDGTAYRHLALAVLRRAVLDLAHPDGLTPHELRSAHDALDGTSAPCRAWCELAGIEPEAIGRLARRLGEPEHASRPLRDEDPAA